LGFQPDDFTRVGQDADPRHRAEKLDAGLEILQLLWSGEPITLHGVRYQMAGAQLLPRPRQAPRIPIWIASQWPHLRPLRRAARFDGVYIASQNADGAPLTPLDIREALAYVKTQRTATSPFAVAFAGKTPADLPAAVSLVTPYAAAGVTWWLEGIWNERGSVAQMRERIRLGPPRLPTKDLRPGTGDGRSA
jgi:alkanesulfonate monooxygenase SsuD/methylene tetrahydromethanopterin reductase-like flavin-dependent oxidoreductase (luciferase family)